MKVMVRQQSGASRTTSLLTTLRHVGDYPSAMGLGRSRTSEDVDQSRSGVGVRLRTYRGDPLASWLHDRVRLSVLSLGLLGLLGSGLVMGVSVAVYALAFPAGTLEDFLAWQSDNWEQAVFWGVVLPGVFGFYGWINVATGDLLLALFRDKVFAWSDSEFEAVLYQGEKALDRVYNHWGWTAAAIVLTTMFTGGTLAVEVLVTPYGGPEPLGENIWAYALVSRPLGIVGAYMLCMIAAKEFATIYSLRRLFQTEAFRLIPLHPDGCGGLQAVSGYALRFGYFLGVAGLGLAVMSVQSVSIGTEHFSRDYVLHFALALYVILAPLTFFASVATAHARMAAHKRALLFWVSSLFDRAQTDVLEAKNGRKPLGEKTLEEVNRLHSLYRTVESFPVWPFDVRTIRIFTAVVVAPVLTVAASTAVSALLGGG